MTLPLFVFNIHYKTALPPDQCCTRMDWAKHASEQYKCSIIYTKIKTNYPQVLATSQSSFRNRLCSCTINTLTMPHVHYSELWRCRIFLCSCFTVITDSQND